MQKKKGVSDNLAFESNFVKILSSVAMALNICLCL